MIAYSYNKITGEFTGEVECQIDPLESLKQKKEIYLIPAGSTEEKPPTVTDGNVLIYDDGWTQREDPRLKIYYDIETAQITKVDLQSDISLLTDLEPCEYPKWDGSKWIVDTEKKKADLLVKADNACTAYIYENIGDTHKQNKYLGRFCELQEKRLDGETLTTEEIAEKDALKELHRRYKAILAEYADMVTRIENGETVEIVFNA